MYTVNNTPPYFKTLQEARMHALEVEPTGNVWLHGMPIIAEIYDDKGEHVGTVGCSPEGFTPNIFYIKSGTTVVNFMKDDGTLVPDRELDVNMDNNMFYLVNFTDPKLPFRDMNALLKFAYSVSEHNALNERSCFIVQDKDDNMLGMITMNNGHPIFIDTKKKKGYEIKANGSYSKQVRYKHGLLELGEVGMRVKI